MAATTVAPAAAGVAVGDFFVCSWGYDQTNVDFFKVVGVTASGKSVKVQKWSSKCVDNPSAPVTHVVPGDFPATVTDWSGEEPVRGPAPVRTKRLSSYDGGKSVYFSVNSFSSAHKWSGQPAYETGSGWGH